MTFDLDSDVPALLAISVQRLVRRGFHVVGLLSQIAIRATCVARTTVSNFGSAELEHQKTMMNHCARAQAKSARSVRPMRHRMHSKLSAPGLDLQLGSVNLE
jgi:hypothetical protein